MANNTPSGPLRPKDPPSVTSAPNFTIPDPGGNASNKIPSGDIAPPASLPAPLQGNIASHIVISTFAPSMQIALIIGLWTKDWFLFAFSAILLLILVYPPILQFLGPLAKFLASIKKFHQ